MVTMYQEGEYLTQNVSKYKAVEMVYNELDQRESDDETDHDTGDISLMSIHNLILILPHLPHQQPLYHHNLSYEKIKHVEHKICHNGMGTFVIIESSNHPK